MGLYLCSVPLTSPPGGRIYARALQADRHPGWRTVRDRRGGPFLVWLIWPHSDSKQTLVGFIVLGLIAVIMLVTAFRTTVREPSSLALPELGLILCLACVASVVLGPLAGASYPFREGAGEFFLRSGSTSPSAVAARFSASLRRWPSARTTGRNRSSGSPRRRPPSPAGRSGAKSGSLRGSRRGRLTVRSAVVGLDGAGFACRRPLPIGVPRQCRYESAR